MMLGVRKACRKLAESVHEIQQKNDQLKAENSKLREYITRLEQAVITLDSDNCDLRNDMKDMQFFVAENNKLRTFLGGNSIVTDYWKDEDGTMHVLTTDGEHTYEYMRGSLAEENAKLRELVCWMYDRMDESCAVHHTYAPAPISYDLLMKALARVHELGIEVDG